MDKQGERRILRRRKVGAAAGLFALCLALGAAGVAFGASSPFANAQADSPTPTPNATIEALMQLDRSVKATQTAQAQVAAPTATLAATLAATPAPTSTALPSKPTVAPTVTPAATSRPLAALAEVLVDGLNIRSGPSSSYASIGKASGGMLLPINGQSGGCSWLRVVLEDGGEGWISGNAAYTAINVPCAAIPAAGEAAAAVQAGSPALPAPTSTPATAARPQAAAQPAAQPAAQVAAPTPTRQPAPVQAAPAQPAAGAPGQLTSFEPLGSWRRGDEPYGTLEQSSEQVSNGAAAARIDYDFPAAAGSKNYVVFLAQPPLRIPNDAASLQLAVYGDGSGNFLNIWVGDADGQTWQFTFGRIQHTGWATMTATLTPNREWPNGPIDATPASPDSLTPPLSLKAFVLDGAADGVAGSGTIYLDNLVASAAAAAPLSAAVAVTTAGAAGSADATAASAPASAPAVAPAPAPVAEPTGKIAFTRFNGQKMNTLVYDVAAGKIVAEIPNTRHPDLAGGLMLANSEGGGMETIIRMSDTGGSPRPITSHPEDTYPQWSPSMASLVYASTAYGDRRSRLFYQEDAGAQFDAPPLLYDKRELFGDNPVYLDNWRIAFQGCNTWAGGSKCGIYSTDSKGSEPVQATSLTADIPTGNLGSQILFTSNRSGNYDVWVVNWDGSDLRQLTDNPAVDGLAAASPDYQHIAFVTNRDGVWSVYVMNADGSNQRKLFDIGGSYGSGEYDWQRERISWGP